MGKMGSKVKDSTVFASFFSDKTPHKMLENDPETSFGRENDVAPRQDRLLARPNRRPAVLLFQGRGHRKDLERDRAGFSGLAGREPRPRTSDLLLPGGPVGVDPAAGRARQGRAGLLGDRGRIRSQQPP